MTPHISAAWAGSKIGQVLLISVTLQTSSGGPWELNQAREEMAILLSSVWMGMTGQLSMGTAPRVAEKTLTFVLHICSFKQREHAFYTLSREMNASTAPNPSFSCLTSLGPEGSPSCSPTPGPATWLSPLSVLPFPHQPTPMPPSAGRKWGPLIASVPMCLDPRALRDGKRHLRSLRLELKGPTDSLS